MSLARHYNGVPSRHVTTAYAAGQQADFDEEIGGFYNDGALLMKTDGFVFRQGPDFISGLGSKGEFRPRRYVIQLAMGTDDAVAGHVSNVRCYVCEDGARVTLSFTALANTVTDAGPIRNRDVKLPTSICPSATVTGVLWAVDNVTWAASRVTISAAGVVTIYNGYTANFTAGPTAHGFEAFSITYDKMSPM